MSIWVQIIPILIISLVIIMFVVLLLRIKLLRINMKRKVVTVKITHWLLLIYGAVLLLSIPFVTLLANDPALGRERVENWNEEQSWSNLYNALQTGNIEQLEPHNLLYQDSFDYDKQLLTVRKSDENGAIFVERKEVDDGKIEAFVLTNGLIVGGYDFTDKLTPNKIQLVDDTLRVFNPSNKIEISIMREEFTINQFSGQSPINDVSSIQLEVYLKIPKSLELVDGGLGVVQYVNE